MYTLVKAQSHKADMIYVFVNANFRRKQTSSLRNDPILTALVVRIIGQLALLYQQSRISCYCSIYLTKTEEIGHKADQKKAQQNSKIRPSNLVGVIQSIGLIRPQSHKSMICCPYDLW